MFAFLTKTVTEKTDPLLSGECEIPKTKANVVEIEDSISLKSQKISIPCLNELVNENQSKDKKAESPDAEVDINLVQIRASTEELNRRIDAFIARKREQVNIVNVQEFCCHRFVNTWKYLIFNSNLRLSLKTKS